MKVHNGGKDPLYKDALRRLLSVAPLSLWPLKIKLVFHRKTTLEMLERISLATFLYGNGSDIKDVMHLLKHRLRDDAARRHIINLTTAFVDQKSRKCFFYFDVNLNDVVHFDHTPHGNPGKRFMQRKINSFSDFCNIHTVNFQMEEAFMHDCDILDAAYFFAHFYTPTSILK